MSPSPTAERLAALHRTAGALTHDLNNLLGVVLSASERLAESLPQHGEQQKLAQIALEAAERSAELLRRALALGQAEPSPVETVDCAEALASLRGLARQVVSPGVRLSVRRPEAPLACAADRTGLEMALFNLCLNAGQATPDGGAVVVNAREARLGVIEARRLGLPRGAYVAFSVRDTGKGMSPEVLARALDPLFTTKATGTGLGLSAVMDFATEAGGVLTLQSCEGKGTTATLHLPLAAAPEVAAAA